MYLGKIKIQLIVLLSLVFLTGCEVKVNIDRPGLRLALGTGSEYNWYIENGERYDLNTAEGNERAWVENNVFFAGEKKVVFVATNQISFFDTEIKQTIRQIKTERFTYAAPCGNEGDLFVISRDKLYYYNFKEDTLKQLHQFAKDENYAPYLYSKVVYCRQRNSLFYTSKDVSKYGIYEMSLDDYQVKKLLDGVVPVYVESEKRIYFISADEHKIQYASIDDLAVKDFWHSERKLVDIDVVSENFIWITHQAKKPLWNGVILKETKLLVNNIVVQPFSKKYDLAGEVVNVKISEQLKQKILELVQKDTKIF